MGQLARLALPASVVRRVSAGSWAYRDATAKTARAVRRGLLDGRGVMGFKGFRGKMVRPGRLGLRGRKDPPDRRGRVRPTMSAISCRAFFPVGGGNRGHRAIRASEDRRASAASPALPVVTAPPAGRERMVATGSTGLRGRLDRSAQKDRRATAVNAANTAPPGCQALTARTEHRGRRVRPDVPDATGPMVSTVEGARTGRRVTSASPALRVRCRPGLSRGGTRATRSRRAGRGCRCKPTRTSTAFSGRSSSAAIRRSRSGRTDA